MNQPQRKLGQSCENRAYGDKETAPEQRSATIPSKTECRKNSLIANFELGVWVQFQLIRLGLKLLSF